MRKHLLLSFFVAFLAASAMGQDARPLTLNSPGTACGHGPNTAVNFTLINVDPGNTVPGTYTYGYILELNGSQIASVTQNATAADSLESFIPKAFSSVNANMTSTGVYTFRVWVTAPGDINNSNDTLVQIVNSDANTVPGEVSIFKGTVSNSDTTVCAGDNFDTLYVVGNVGQVQDWLKNEGGGWVPVAGSATTDSFIVYDDITVSTVFATVVRSGSCPLDTTDSVYTVNVDPITNPGTITGLDTFCVGQPVNLTLTGNNGAVIKWESADNMAGPWDSVGTGTSYSIPSVTTADDSMFRVISAAGLCPQDTTPVKTIKIFTNSIGGTTSLKSGDDTICQGIGGGVIQLMGNTGVVTTWQADTGTGFFNIPGSGGFDTLAYSALLQTTAYQALVQNGNCTPISSTSFTVEVDPLTNPGTLGPPFSICTGGGGTLTVSGHVGDILGWEIDTSGSFVAIPGTADSTTIGYGPLFSPATIRVQVKSGKCAQQSASINISINSVTDGGSIALAVGTNDTVCEGNNMGTLNHVGGNGTIQRWEVDSTGSFLQVVPLNNSPSLNFTNIGTTQRYRVFMQNGSCPGDYSDTMLITVLPKSVAGSISGDAAVCENSAANLSLSGQSGSVVYWWVSTNGGVSYDTVPGSAGQTSISPIVATNSLFQVEVQNGICDSAMTADFSVTADPTTVPGTITPANSTVCAGNDTVVFLLGPHTGNVIRWIQSIDGGSNWTNVVGSAGDTTITITNWTDTTLITARVRSGLCPEDSPVPAVVDVIPLPIGGTARIVTPSPDTICVGSVFTGLTLDGTHDGDVIAWEFSTDGGANYTLQPGSATENYATLFSYSTTTLWRALIRRDPSCDTVRSTPAQMTVNDSTVGGTISGSTTVCGGTGSGTLTLNGSVGTVDNWEFSDNNGASWNNAGGAGSNTLPFAGLNDTTWYRALVSNGLCPQDTSDTAIIQVIPAAIGGVVKYAGTSVCADTNLISLTLDSSSGTVQNWQRSTDSTNWVDVVPAVTDTFFSDTNVAQTTWYRVRLQAGACPPVNSAPGKVVVDQLSDVGTIFGSTQHCDTGNAGFVHITGFTGTPTGWRSRINGGAFSARFDVGDDTTFYNNLTAGDHEYQVFVESGACAEDTSTLVLIEVDAALVTGTLSGGTSYCDTANATLLQLASYTDSVVHWISSTNGGASWTNIGLGGQDTATFKNVMVTTMYGVIVTSGNGNCGTDTSNIQTITIGQSIGGTLNSSAQVCISGHSALMQLTGYSGTILQWEDSSAIQSWNSIGNGGIDTLRYTNLPRTTAYRVIVQSGSCNPDTSTIALIIVDDTVDAGVLDTNMTFCDTVNMDTLFLRNSFGPILNWQYAVNGGPFTDSIPSKTDTSLIFTNLIDSITQFRVVMNGGVCGNDTSNIVSVQVGASLGGQLFSGDTVCANNNGGVLRLVGYRGNILGWDSSTVSGIFAPIGHTLDSLVYLNIDDTVTYRVRVQNPGCPPDTSDSVTIVTIPGTTVGNLTGSRSICDTINTDSVILVGRQGTILLWEFSTDGGMTWDTLKSGVGPTPHLTDTFIFFDLKVTTMYRVTIDSSASCPMQTSNIVTIQVGPSDAGVIAGDTLICAGDTANMVLNGSIGSVLGWEFSDNGGLNWFPIADTNTFLNQIINVTTEFRVIVQSDTCTPDTSASHVVVVDQPYTAGLTTPTTQLCYGIGSDTIFLVGTPDTIFDWFIRPDTAGSFTSLVNNTNSQTYDTLKVTTHYKVFVQNGVCPVDSAEITLTVDTFTLAGSITSNIDTVCAGGNTGTITLSGHIGNDFTWETSTDSVNWVPAPGAANDTFYVFNDLTDTAYFRVIVASGGCPPETTNAVLIIVKPAAVAGTLAGTTSFCEGPNGGSIVHTGVLGTVSEWQVSIGGGPFTTVTPPNTTDTLNYLNLDTTTLYRVIVSLGDCPDDTSDTAAIFILQTPVASITPDGPTSFCEGGLVNLTASGGPDYLWSTSDTIPTIQVTNTGSYSVTVTDTLTGCTDADTIQVTQFASPVVSAGQPVIITSGQSTILNASGAVTYVWSPATDLDDPNIANPTASPTLTTTYTVVGTDSNGCTGIDSVIINVIPGEDTTEVVEFSNLFTPNGDGHNDYWKVTQLANCSQCKVAVYNRYGQEVLRDDNYQDNWTGTYNGKDLPDGTYYYVVQTEDGRIYKGAITVMRGN